MKAVVSESIVCGAKCEAAADAVQQQQSARCVTRQGRRLHRTPAPPQARAVHTQAHLSAASNARVAHETSSQATRGFASATAMVVV